MSALSHAYENREDLRLADLQSFNILDSPREEDYDHIVSLARLIADTPAAYITFIDSHRLWFKSVVGLPPRDIERKRTYCHFVIETNRYMLIEDAWTDPRFLVASDGTIQFRDCSACEPAGISVEMPVPTSSADVEEPPRGYGPVRFYLGVPLRSKAGNVLGTLCVADFQPRQVDASIVAAMESLAQQVSALLELRRANATLETERETFTTLFEVAPVSLVLLEGGVIRRANHVFAAMVTDRETSGLDGMPLSAFLRDRPVQPGGVLETELRNEAGHSIPVNVYFTRLKLQGVYFDLLALYDVSDRREKERILGEQRAQAENAARIKDTFLSLVSHDLKSPLSGIYSMLDLLATAGDSFSVRDRNEVIHDLRSSAALMMEMIQQLLNIHRLESGQLRAELTDSEIVPIAQDIMLSLNRQITEKKLNINVSAPPGFTVPVDEALIREALFNLVSNAVKFSPIGGTIRIEVVAPETDSLAEIRVTDQGAGVPPEDVPNLFRKEVKTSRPGTAGEGGTGLGLPLVRDIMRAHGGNVDIRETGPEGTCFVLTIPTSMHISHDG